MKFRELPAFRIADQNKENDYAQSVLHIVDFLPELSRLGSAYYDENLRPILEPGQNNQFVALHLDSEGYRVAKTANGAMDAILEQHPIDRRIIVRKIGSEPEYGFAGRVLAGEPELGRFH